MDQGQVVLNYDGIIPAYQGHNGQKEIHSSA